jgi:hypothetical protein
VEQPALPLQLVEMASRLVEQEWWRVAVWRSSEMQNAKCKMQKRTAPEPAAERLLLHFAF